MISCACGCGEPVPIARFPSLQRRYINGHQHRGAHNGNYRGGKSERPCAVCGQPFLRWPSKPDARTCGDRSCYATWMRLTTTARGRNKVVFPCSQCSASLYRFPSQVEDLNFCSRVCQGLHQATKVGPASATWTGTSRRHVRSEVAARDQFRCVICGFDLAFDIHHITPVKQGGKLEPGNLITLCPNHHRLAHAGVIALEHLRPPVPASR